MNTLAMALLIFALLGAFAAATYFLNTTPTLRSLNSEDDDS